MTTGEKISKLRREKNWTQEQFADILRVTRQAVGKWENDLAIPETEKLVEMSRFFNCSVDYLLKYEVDNESEQKEDDRPNLQSFNFLVKRIFRERKSERTFLGLPLFHCGKNAKGVVAIGRTAKGIVAIGLKAQGVIPIGLFSIGVIPLGLLSIGILPIALFAIGLISFGTFSLGVISFGAISIGIMSVGAVSIGEVSVGALAIGKYVAVGDSATAMVAIGKTWANGSVYSFSGELVNANIEEIKTAINQVLPPILSWCQNFVLNSVLLL